MNNLSAIHFAQRKSIVFTANSLNLKHSSHSLNLVIDLVHQKIVSSCDLYLMVVGLHPTSAQLEDIEFHLNENKGNLDLLHYLDKQIERSPYPKNQIFFTAIEGTSIMDVSQTQELSFTSGIQRVVREVFKASAFTHKLGYWDQAGCVFTIMDVQRIQDFINMVPNSRNDKSSPIMNTYFFENQILLYETAAWSEEIYKRYIVISQRSQIETLIYDDIPLSQPYFTDAATRNGFPLFLKYSLAFSRTILCISLAQLSQVQKWQRYLEPTSKAKLKIKTLSSFCGCVSPTKSSACRPSKRRILLVGTFDMRKNFLSIFPALARLPRNLEIELVFVGPGGGFENELKEFLRLFLGKNPSHRCLILRNISDDELHFEYSKADFSVFLSSAEGYGLPVIESLAHGTPVLISTEPSVLETAGSQGFIAVDAKSQVDIDAAVLKLCTQDLFLDSLTNECIENFKIKTSRDD
jgi:glycosyltransferase involved in cell wall biosynthesis